MTHQNAPTLIQNSTPSNMVSNKYPTIGLIEVPATGLYDAEGNNWTSLYRHRSLISKQVLIADLQAGGFDARLVNLRKLM
jgi:hypothetical protein